jgi:hypothetical protein
VARSTATAPGTAAVAVKGGDIVEDGLAPSEPRRDLAKPTAGSGRPTDQHDANSTDHGGGIERLDQSRHKIIARSVAVELSSPNRNKSDLTSSLSDFSISGQKRMNAPDIKARAKPQAVAIQRPQTPVRRLALNLSLARAEHPPYWEWDLGLHSEIESNFRNGWRFHLAADASARCRFDVVAWAVAWP